MPIFWPDLGTDWFVVGHRIHLLPTDELKITHHPLDQTLQTGVVVGFLSTAHLGVRIQRLP